MTVFVNVFSVRVLLWSDDCVVIDIYYGW